MPLFWFGIMMMLVCSMHLHWLPASGYGTWKHLILPMVSLGIWNGPITMRLVRSQMLDILSQDFVRSARARGLREYIVIWRHAFKNALIPVVTVVGTQFGQLLGGAIVCETVFSWPGDRIESGTFVTIAAITGSDLLLRGCVPEHLDAVILKLKDAGVVFRETERGLRVVGPRRPLARDITTMPYPGFPTDMQAQFMALMTVAHGSSVIKETIFGNRFMHVAELRRMGADIATEAGTATVRGVERLRGAEVMATDLRASACLVVAALNAKGRSVIHRIYHLDRGYDRIDRKLRRLGAEIERITS